MGAAHVHPFDYCRYLRSLANAVPEIQAQRQM